MVRIVLADDHVMIRQAIARALADVDGFNVVGQASTAEESIEVVARLTPDVVLMDIGMPGMGGLAATEIICKDYPQVAVLMLTIHDREDYFFKALNAGASGYILKGATSGELVGAIRSVHQGGVYLTPVMAGHVVGEYHRFREKALKAGDDGLTGRESEVLRLIAQGLTNQEIAEALHLSVYTVQSHRAHIMRKLGLENRHQLMKYASQKGYLDETP